MIANAVRPSEVLKVGCSEGILQDHSGAIVADVAGVVERVILAVDGKRYDANRTPREVVVAVPSVALTDPPRSPVKQGDEMDVAAEKLGSKTKRNDCADDVINGVVVVGSEWAHCYELVMYFVKLVQVFVRNPMEEVKEYRFYHYTDGQLNYKSEAGRHFRRKAHFEFEAVQVKESRHYQQKVEEIEFYGFVAQLSPALRIHFPYQVFLGTADSIPL